MKPTRIGEVIGRYPASKIQEAEDMVNSPKHYKLRGLDIESVDVIKATLTPEEFQGWLKGNAMKYLHRLGKKDDAVQDAKKAMKYLEWLVKEIEK